MSEQPINLPSNGPFAGLTEAERGNLLPIGELCKFSEGDLLIQEGGEQNHLYVLISGRAKVMQKHVAPAVTAWLESEESFGEVNLFDLEDAGASASVEAAEDVLVWRIDRNGLNEFIGSHPEASLRLTIGLASLLSKRLRAMNQLMKEMSVWTHS